MKETKGEIIEVSKICGECWKEDKIVIPIFEVEGDTIREHNHEDMKKRKEILEALKEG